MDHPIPPLHPLPRRDFIRTVLAVAGCVFVCLLVGRSPAAPTTDTLRIVTLAPNLTQSVETLGLAARIVGITDFCTPPADARSPVRLGGLYNPNTEQLLALRPTHVVLHHSQKQLIAPLKAAGVEALVVPSDSIADIEQGLAAIGRYLRIPDRGSAAAASLRTQLAAIRQRAAHRPRTSRPRVLVAISHAPGSLNDLYAAGSGTYLDDLLVVAGADNALGKTAATYPLVSRESLQATPPDLVIDLRSDPGDDANSANDAATQRAWEQLFPPDKSGRRKSRIVLLRDLQLAVPGPRVVEAADRLERLIAGEAAASR